MNDPCGYTRGHPWHIPQEQLDDDPHLKAFLRRTYAEKMTKIQAVVLGCAITFVCTIISAGIIRHLEYKHSTKNCSVDADSLVELFLRVENTERLASKIYDVSRSDFKVCKDVQYKVTDLHRKQHPDKYLNAFGRSNTDKGGK